MLIVLSSNSSFAAPAKEAKKEVWILPLVTFYDVSRDATYNWWSEMETTSLDAEKHSQRLLSYLGKKSEGAIHYYDPYKTQIRFRKDLNKTNLSLEELQQISQSLKAELILSGDVIIEESPVISAGKRLKIQLKVLRSPLFNEVAESVRVVDLHSFEYAQLLEGGGDVWGEIQGALDQKIKAYRVQGGAQRVELIVNGSLDRRQMKHFEQLLKSKIERVKAVSQSFTEPGSSGIFVEYEGGSATALGEDLRVLKWDGFMTQVVSSSSSQVIFDVHPQTAVK